MDIKKLNEEIQNCLNEISDRVKGKALGKRITKARKFDKYIKVCCEPTQKNEDAIMDDLIAALKQEKAEIQKGFGWISFDQLLTDLKIEYDIDDRDIPRPVIKQKAKQILGSMLKEPTQKNEAVNAAKVKQDVEKAVKDYFKNDKDALEYVYVDSKKGNHGRTIIEVRAELGYNGMTKLADHLDKVVQKYDKYAYFEQESGGIMTAVFESAQKNQSKFSSQSSFNKAKDIAKDLQITLIEKSDGSLRRDKIHDYNYSMSIGEVAFYVDDWGYGTQEYNKYKNANIKTLNKGWKIELDNIVSNANKKYKDYDISYTMSSDGKRIYFKIVENKNESAQKNESKISEAGKDYKHARELGYSDAQDFNVGDQVKLIWSGRTGIITKQIGVDVYEIEFPETPGLMARTDRYYANDLELVKSKIIDNKEVDINESQKVLVSTDYGVSATLLINEPNEEYKFVIVDQDGDGISWSDSEEEVINQYIEYMIKHEPETDAISDIMTKEDSVKDSRIKQAFTNYLDSLW